MLGIWRKEIGEGSLEGQVALVTGGGRGLGRSIVRALAAQGAAVAIDDIFRDEADVSAAEITSDEIEASGGRALALAEDVTTSAGAKAMVDQAVERFGRLDILVCCAGNMVRGLLHELTEQQWDSLLDLHLKGHFLSCKMALPHMLEQDFGRILTVSSRGAFFQVPSSKRDSKDVRKPPSTPYSAAKAGIMGLTTTLAVELWDTGINVNCLLPSATTQLFPDTRPRMVDGVPASESLDPDDVAPTAVYLCSPDARDISGKIVYASGGDLILYGEQLSTAGSRMIRKHGRWTQEELAAAVPPLLDIPWSRDHASRGYRRLREAASSATCSPSSRSCSTNSAPERRMTGPEASGPRCAPSCSDRRVSPVMRHVPAASITLPSTMMSRRSSKATSASARRSP